MGLVFRLIFGSFLVVLGFVMVWRTIIFINITGKIDWAEEKLGPGGTWSFLKIVGVIVIMLGFMFITNLIENLGGSIASIFVPKQL
ncbi:MAG: hypothetical protein V1821_04175 [bacterium]